MMCQKGNRAAVNVITELIKYDTRRILDKIARFSLSHCRSLLLFCLVFPPLFFVPTSEKITGIFVFSYLSMGFVQDLLTDRERFYFMFGFLLDLIVHFCVLDLLVFRTNYLKEIGSMLVQHSMLIRFIFSLQSLR